MRAVPNPDLPPQDACEAHHCDVPLPGCILRTEEVWPHVTLRLLTLAPRPAHMRVLAPERDTLLVQLTGAGRIAACPGGARLVARHGAQGPCNVLSITFDTAGTIRQPNSDVDDRELRIVLSAVALALEGGPPVTRAAALHAILARLALLPAPAVARRGGLPPHALRRVLAFMEARVSDPPDLAEMAAQAGLSPAYFCTAVRRATGQSPQRLLRDRQLARAAALLSGTALELTEIALSCGFGSSSHFAAAFRAASGMTASAYRRAFRQSMNPSAGHPGVTLTVATASMPDPLPRPWLGAAQDQLRAVRRHRPAFKVPADPFRAGELREGGLAF